MTTSVSVIDSVGVSDGVSAVVVVVVAVVAVSADALTHSIVWLQCVCFE